MNAAEPGAPGPLTPPKLRVARLVFWGFAAVAAYFLWTEHRAHAIQILPWALVAACPLMHLFMHRGHARHSEGGSRERRGDS